MQIERLPSTHELSSSLEAGRRRLADADLVAAGRRRLADADLLDAPLGALVSVRDAALEHVPGRRRSSRRRRVMMVLAVGGLVAGIAVLMAMVRRRSAAAQPAEPAEAGAGADWDTPGGEPLAAVASSAAAS